MKPTVRTQPYRRGGREPGGVLSAILAGRPMYAPNPQDVARAAQVLRRKRAKRVKRG